MKGMVFTMLGDMVEREFGIETWDRLIEDTNPESGGVYTSVEVYPDSELLGYVAALSRRLEVPADALVYAFGKYLLSRFDQIHPEFFEGHSARSFLRSIDQQIHVEVRKLHPGVVLPSFEYEDLDEKTMRMIYRSPRQLCKLAEGLIAGSAERFGTTIDLDHRQCMRNGADSCELLLRFSEKEVVVAA